MPIRPRAMSAVGRTVTFSDGSSSEYDVVIWATGFSVDHSWIDVPGAMDDQGQVRHERGVTPVPGLYMLGLTWQHTRTSALLGWVVEDAAFLAATDHLGGCRCRRRSTGGGAGAMTPVRGRRLAVDSRPRPVWGVVFGPSSQPRHSPSGGSTTRTVYALGLVLIASVYIGFAVADGRPRSSSSRASLRVFTVIAAVAVTGSVWLLVMGLAGHGLKPLAGAPVASSPAHGGGRRSARSSTGLSPRSSSIALGSGSSLAIDRPATPLRRQGEPSAAASHRMPPIGRRLTRSAFDSVLTWVELSAPRWPVDRLGSRVTAEGSRDPGRRQGLS